MPKTYLLLCATKPEWSEFKKRWRFEAAEPVSGFPRYRLAHGGLRLELCQTGIGGKRADACARALAAMAEPRWDGVVHFGLSGGLKAEFKPGDLFLPERVVDADGGEFRPSAPLRERAKAACAARILPYREGRLLTSETVLSTPAQKAAAGGFADIVDMETYAAARAFEGKGIPFLPVRAVFDPLDWDLTALEHTMNPDGTIKPASLAREVAASPKLLMSLPRYQKAASAGNRAIFEFVNGFLEKDDA